MNVIYRTDVFFDEKSLKTDSYAKRLSEYGGIENWLYSSFSKYLSENATLRLSLFVKKNDIAEAKLDIRDSGLHVYASADDANKEYAVVSAISKCSSQLAKLKNKAIVREPFMKDDLESFEDLDARIDLDSELVNAMNIAKDEKKLAEKKETPRYIRTMDRYVSYLYSDSEIQRAEKHLNMLYSILESEKDTILHKDYLLLTDSIKQVKNEINSLIQSQVDFESNVRDQSYIEESIEEEFRLLKAKRG